MPPPRPASTPPGSVAAPPVMRRLRSVTGKKVVMLSTRPSLPPLKMVFPGPFPLPAPISVTSRSIVRGM